MTSIRDAARIIHEGQEVTPAVVAEVIKAPCVGPGCENEVSKDGNACSLTCMQASQVHTAPCSQHTCEVMECQVEILLVRHLMEQEQGGMSREWCRVTYDEAYIALLSLLNDPTHTYEDANFFLDAALREAQVMAYTRDAAAQRAVHIAHRQAEKPVLEAPAKAVRAPRTKKHQPRTTDGREHPVVVTRKEKENTMSEITLSPAQMQAAIEQAVERQVQERLASILGAKEAQVAPEDVPAVPREGAGVILPGFVVDSTLTVEPLHVGDLTLDTVVTAATRSPYNKALYRLAGAPPLSKDVTYRTLVGIHNDLLNRAATRQGQRVAKQAEAQAIAEAKTNKTHVWKGKPVTEKQFTHFLRLASGRLPENSGPTIAAQVNPTASAKVAQPTTTLPPKVVALMNALNITQEEAINLILTNA